MYITIMWLHEHVH